VFEAPVSMFEPVAEMQPKQASDEAVEASVEDPTEESTYRFQKTVETSQVEKEPEGKPNELRSVLSEMFGIDLNPTSSLTQETSVGEEYPLQLEHEPEGASGSSAPPLNIGDLSEIEGAISGDLHSESAADPEAALESVIPLAETSEDEESVSSYMNRLLARLRNDSDGDPAVAVPSRPTLNRPTIEPSAAPMKPESEEEAALLTELPPPINPLNAEELREGISSLRRLANTSARSAVASYHWKKTRGHLIFSTTLSAGALVAFIYLAMTEGTSELTFAALAVGVVMLGETYRIISRVKKLREVAPGPIKKTRKLKRSDGMHINAPAPPENHDSAS